MTDAVDGQARADLRSHLDVCTERYGNLWTAVNRMEKTLNEYQTQNHARFNMISTRMWTIVTSSLGATILGLAFVIFSLIKH